MTLEGSPTAVLDEMEAESNRQLAWLRSAGRSRSDIMESQGEAAAAAGTAQAIGQVGQAASSGAAWMAPAPTTAGGSG